MMTFGQAMKLGIAATQASRASYLSEDLTCAIGAPLYAVGYRYGRGVFQLQQRDCVSLINERWPYTTNATVGPGLSLVGAAELKFMFDGFTRDEVAEWVMQWERDHGILVEEPQPAEVEEEVGV